MNLDSLTAALSHIGNLVASLTKKNLNSSAQEIQEVSVIFVDCVCLSGYAVVMGNKYICGLVWSAVMRRLCFSLQLDAASSPAAAHHQYTTRLSHFYPLFYDCFCFVDHFNSLICGVMCVFPPPFVTS